MNLLLTIVRNIALLVLISSFWELLAPRGSLRGPVRLVIGLLLVSCVILPLTDALARGSEPWLLDLPEQPSAEQTLAAGQDIAGRMQGEVRESYEQDVSRQIAAMCLLSENVSAARAAARADSNGGLTQVVIEAELMAGADTDSVRDRLIQMICTFFPVEEAAIECSVEEARSDGAREKTPR